MRGNERSSFNFSKMRTTVILLFLSFPDYLLAFSEFSVTGISSQKVSTMDFTDRLLRTKTQWSQQLLSSIENVHRQFLWSTASS